VLLLVPQVQELMDSQSLVLEPQVVGSMDLQVASLLIAHPMVEEPHSLVHVPIK
jgi:hypothetical protein